jgi:lipopolysaccharide/colanic/teichoic acid biosynthesis glycosyltransferase
MMKRAFDILGGTIGLICSAPIMLASAALVYRESPGPILFRQTRVGKDNKEFTIYKIRSMRLNASQECNWSTQEDSRRLEIGKFIRKWSIDELPQFWNVIKGDMSLVGPRPEIPEHVERFSAEIPLYKSRHSVKPGMTGLAQISGFRGDTCIRKRVVHDIAYIRNRKLLTDFWILIKTPFIDYSKIS